MAKPGAEAFAAAGMVALGQCQLSVGIQVERDQLGEQLEHAGDGRIVQGVGLGINRTQGAEEAAVRQDDGDGDIALKAILGGRWVAAEHRVLRDIVYHHAGAAAADLVADGGLQQQLAARHQVKADIVPGGAADPAIVGDTRHRGKAHAGGAADHFQNGGNRRNGGDGVEVSLEIVRHEIGQQENTI